MQKVCSLVPGAVATDADKVKNNPTQWRSAFVLYVTVLAMFLVGTQAWADTALSNATGLYARAIRLSHNANASDNGNVVASVTAFPNGVGEEDIYGSPDGTTFTQIGSIQDPDFAGGLCCGTLFELSSAVGTLQAGTLLWAGSVGQSSTTQPMQIKIYKSTDQGVTWTYLSSLATATSPDNVGGGLWEPDFTIASDGALVGFYSDETVAGHSQLLHKVRSYDGLTWQDSSYAVASGLQPDRPGMAVVTKLPSGIYFMSFELCGPAACTVFEKTSTDGWDWGDPGNVGNRVTTTDGQWFQAAPTNAWAPSATNSNGTILVVGQSMYGPSGLSSGNGITIFTNHTADGSGAWSTMPAPVPVPDAYVNYCPNYSSPLLPSVDGSTVLEFASDYAGTTCTMYFGTGPILAGTVAPTIAVAPGATTVTSFPLTVEVSVTGPSSDPVATGKVTLSSGSYSSSQTLSGGATTFTLTSWLPGGPNTLTASYLGDSNYTSGTGTASVNIVAPPTVTVTPANSIIAVGQAERVTITVAGPAGDVTPTGAVTLSSGAYSSGAVALSNGSATVNIPANSLSVGNDTLSAAYSGDGTYTQSSGSSSITVASAPGFTLSANSPTINPEASSGNAISVTVTPFGGFTGSVALTWANVQVTPSTAGAFNPPTLSFGSSSPVSITSGAAQTATLTVTTAASATAMGHRGGNGVPWRTGGGVALGCILLLGSGRRRRDWRTLLGVLLMVVAAGGGIVACGSSKAVNVSGTTPGTYSVTVTGTSGTATVTQSVLFTIE